MAKKKILTRDEKIEVIRETFKEVPTTTRVRAWVFIVEKQHYVVISYFASRQGDNISVYPSNRKGIKIADAKSVVEIKNCKDPNMGFEAAIEILVPHEAENAEIETTENA